MIDAYLYQPREISIETLTLCNAACEFCPYPTLDRKGNRMSDEMLGDLFNQMREWKEPFSISPFKVNEPFLDKRLLQICRDIIAGIRVAKLRLFTNGSRFTQDNVNELLDLAPERVQHIWISLNQVDTVLYKETMKYVAFEHVAEKIDILYNTWQRRVRHRIVISRVSEADKSLEQQRHREFDDYIWKRWKGFTPFHIKRDAWIDYTHAAEKVVPHAPCARWWELNIMSTGVAALCCMDGTGEYAVGNAVVEPLLDIYNKSFLLDARKRTKLRSVMNPCKRCTY